MGVIFLSPSPSSLWTESPSWFLGHINEWEKKTQDSWCGSSAISWEAEVQLLNPCTSNSPLYFVEGAYMGGWHPLGVCWIGDSGRRPWCTSGVLCGWSTTEVFWTTRQRARIKHGGGLSSCFNPKAPLGSEAREQKLTYYIPAGTLVAV